MSDFIKTIVRGKADTFQESFDALAQYFRCGLLKNLLKTYVVYRLKNSPTKMLLDRLVHTCAQRCYYSGKYILEFLSSRFYFWS